MNPTPTRIKNINPPELTIVSMGVNGSSVVLGTSITVYFTFPMASERSGIKILIVY